MLADCAEYALRAPETYGIWGAMTARERAALRRRRVLGTKGRIIINPPPGRSPTSHRKAPNLNEIDLK